jgi:hypothetical protein
MNRFHEPNEPEPEDLYHPLSWIEQQDAFLDRLASLVADYPVEQDSCSESY